MVSAIMTAVAVGGAYGLTAGLVAGAISAYSSIKQQSAMRDAKRAQERARAEAEANAESAKGTQLVVTGEPAALKVCYGRGLVGGVRVFHSTQSSFVPSTPPAGFMRFDAGTALQGAISGSKHEFLITQQAIAAGGISACFGVDVDERLISGENVNTYNEVVWDGSGTRVSPFEYGAAASVCLEGGAADPLCYLNDSSRNNSRFTGVAYATGVYRYNRDDPQYSGVPSMRFYTEGRKVRELLGTLGARFVSSYAVYSNNPALVLLDYLMSPTFGLGLSSSKLDLDTFYAAYRICDAVMMPSVPLEGKLWRLKGGTRSIRRFECNLAIDTNVPIRDNIENILATMDYAQLLWSGGKYKLVLSYPLLYSATVAYAMGDVVQYTVNGAVSLYVCTMPCCGVLPTNTSNWKSAVAATITDDDLLRKGEITVAWPTAQTRLNFATVRYLNEAKDFSEDTAVWPPKDGALYSTFLQNDSGLPLETEVFATGVTSYYHALAKAEGMVRKSRNSVTYSFSVGRALIALEPGDHVVLDSDVVGVPGELLTILEVEPDGDGAIKVSAEKFDAATLAWNVADTEYVPPRNIYATELPNLSQGNITFAANGGAGVLTWQPLADSRVSAYLVMTASSDQGSATEWVERGLTSIPKFFLPDVYSSAFVATVVPTSIRGQKANKAGWPILAIPYAGLGAPSGFAYEVNSSGILLKWSPVSSQRLSHYEVRRGADWDTGTTIATQKSTILQLAPQTVTSTAYHIRAVDINGAFSAVSSLSFVITAPAAVRVTANVIDNNVMLYWSASASQQQVSHYEIRKGATYANSEFIGKITSLFTVLFEVLGGQQRYWVTPVDVGGNAGEPASVVAAVNQPPNYALRNEFTSALAAEAFKTFTSANATVVDAYVVSGYASADYTQNNLQIATGGFVSEVFDIGQGSPLSIAVSRASVTLDYTSLSGTPVVSVKIDGSADGVTFSSNIASIEANLYSFRYVRVRIDVSGGSIVLKNYKLRLSTRTVRDTGSCNCLASDAAGTAVLFTQQFADVIAINVTPISATPVIAVVDFVDALNPTGFKVLLFNQSGERVSGSITFVVDGVA